MELKDCDLCPERKYARAPVPGKGNLNLARICLLGRNPGVNEDLKGEPFISRAGRELAEGLILAGILRNECYITNVSKCMTPPNITPSITCQKNCRVWLNAEMAALERLKLIVTLGNEALKYLEPLARVGELHGCDFVTDKPWQEVGRIRIFVSFHPSAALRSSTVKEMFKKDMLKLKTLVEEMGM